MAKYTKFYRKDYRYLFLSKKDLRRLIKLFQKYCNAPIILIDGMRIEQADQIDLLTASLASEMIITGLALHPTIIDKITSTNPSLQLRITGQNARLSVRADARKDFQELIDRIDAMFTGSVNISKLQIFGILQVSPLAAGIGTAISPTMPLGARGSNEALFWIFNGLCIGFLGAIFWIWSRLVDKIAPTCVLSLDDTQAKAAWTRRKCLDMIGIIINLAMPFGIIALRHFFWLQFGFNQV